MITLECILAQILVLVDGPILPAPAMPASSRIPAWLRITITLDSPGTSFVLRVDLVFQIAFYDLAFYLFSNCRFISVFL